MSGVTRRDLLFKGLFRRAVAPQPAPPSPPPPAPTPHRPGRPMPWLRPPGALPETEFMAACTRCSDCLNLCPHGAIFMASDRYREAEGTPMIDPARAPCWMCADTPCITACLPRALVRRGDALPRMGTARILTLNCLAHEGTPCTTCFERCPVPGALRVDDGRPAVFAELCTGCGVCQHVCPAPRNAILLSPSLRQD
jgi:ferredoxin-type protein NapG